MPVVVSDGSNRQGGVYRAVRDAMERDAQLHAERIAGWPVDPKDHPYRMQRILDALRAGEVTDVPMWVLPKAALRDQPRARGARTGRSGDASVLYKAVVRPDDTVTFEVDDGSAMMEYLDI